MQRWLTRNSRQIVPAGLRRRRQRQRQRTTECVCMAWRDLLVSGVSARPLASQTCHDVPKFPVFQVGSQNRSFSTAASNDNSGPAVAATATAATATATATAATTNIPDDADEQFVDVNALPADSDDGLYVYRENLNNWYRVHFSVSLKNAFETTMLASSLVDKDSPSQQLWTATFVCPVTGFRIHAQKLPRLEFTQVEDGIRYYYTNKKLANQAAAMGAVYHFCPRDELNETKYAATVAQSDLQLWYMKHHQMFLSDDAFTTCKKNFSGKYSGGTWWNASFRCPIEQEVFPAGTISAQEHCIMGDGNVYYRRKGDALHAAIQKALVAKEEGMPGVSKEESLPVIDTEEVTIDPLRLWYRKHHDITLTDENFVTSYSSWKGAGGILWTASFICPVTGDRFDSGELRKEGKATEYENGQWYRRKRHAHISAGLLAHDYLVYQSTGTNEPRFCNEDPSVRGEDSFSSQGLPTVLSNEARSNIAPPDLDSPLSDTDDVQASEEIDVGDDDDDYVIEFIPQRIGETIESPVSAPTTLDIVAQTWIETTRGASTNEKGGREQSEMNPEVERYKAIARATTWVRKQLEDEFEHHSERTQFDDPRLPSNRTMGKMLLESLASSHHRIPHSRYIVGVEQAARSILEILWSSPTSAPDADCYALYIKCLEGSHTNMIAKSTNIYNAMSKRLKLEGHLPPPPNVAVYNSLIQCKAAVGVKTPLSDLENREINRETILSCLSAIAHASGKGGSEFDTQYVLDCIQKMKTTAAERGDVSLEPGIDVYNAPMRWSRGGAALDVSRPYSRSIACDDIDSLYESKKDTFHIFSEQDPEVSEAQGIDNWCKSIQSGAFGSAIRPNFETYESVMQAWVRTGTSEGLQHAESILEFLDRDGMEEWRSRTHAFHPFIAALAYTGEYERVDRWANKIENTNSVIDNRFRLARILARAASKDRVLANGTECLRLLSALNTDPKDSSGAFVDAHAFMMTITALYNQGSGVTDIFDQSILDIEQTVEAFDGFLLSLGQLYDDRSLRQRHHLAKFAPGVYSLAFLALRDLSIEEDQSSFMQRLTWLEKIIRRSDEHRILALKLPHTQEEDNRDNPSPYEDEFQYNYARVLFDSPSSSWMDFHSLVMNTLSDKSVNEECGCNSELVRLYILVSGMLQPHTDSTNPTSNGTHDEFVEGMRNLVGDDPIVAQIQLELGSKLVKQPPTRITGERVTNKKEHPKSLRAKGDDRSRDGLKRRRTRKRERNGTKPTRRPQKNVNSPSSSKRIGQMP